jgi:hypothetical protein
MAPISAIDLRFDSPRFCKAALSSSRCAFAGTLRFLAAARSLFAEHPLLTLPRAVEGLALDQFGLVRRRRRVSKKIPAAIITPATSPRRAAKIGSTL